MAENVYVAGAFRNGLSIATRDMVAVAENKRAAGFRQLPYESTVVELIDLLDSADALVEELLITEECDCKE